MVSLQDTQAHVGTLPCGSSRAGGLRGLRGGEEALPTPRVGPAGSRREQASAQPAAHRVLALTGLFWNLMEEEPGARRESRKVEPRQVQGGQRSPGGRTAGSCRPSPCPQ